MVSLIVDEELLQPAATLRIRFRKEGSLQYISHLDLLRTFTKVLVRSGLPVWYSEGFNPKPRISFATPMSIGLESDYELLDVKIIKRVDPNAVKEALNRHLTPECAVEEVYLPQQKFTEIDYSTYVFRIRHEGMTQALAEECISLLQNGPCPVFKRSKSGDKTVDVHPMIRKVEGGLEGEELVLRCALSIGGDQFLNPEYLVTLLKEQKGLLAGSPLENWYTIRRTGVYLADGGLFR